MGYWFVFVCFRTAIGNFLTVPPSRTDREDDTPE